MDSVRTTPQGPGRPTGETDRRDRLLDAAERQFAERGFAATPVRAVAEEAGVNPALVHYYFGSKFELLQAVFDRVFEPLAEAIARMGRSGKVDLEELIGLLFEAFGHNPALPRLIVREVMLGAGPMREHFVRAYAPRLGGALVPVLSREQAAGRIDPELHPALLVINILSLCVFPFVAAPVAAEALQLELDQETRSTLQAQVERLLRQGVS
jgi:AcrR family transcriptional regulator